MKVKSATCRFIKLRTRHKKCCRYMHQNSENGQKVLSVSAPKIRKSIKKWLTRDDDNSKVEHFCEAKVSVSKETCQSYRSEQKIHKGRYTFLKSHDLCKRNFPHGSESTLSVVKVSKSKYFGSQGEPTQSTVHTPCIANTLDTDRRPPDHQISVPGKVRGLG